MTVISPTPLVIKDALVQVAVDSYEAAVTSVAFTPSASVITATAVAPGAVYTDVSPATWTADITFLQDWNDPASLANYLFDHEGETVAMTFQPKNGDGASFSAEVVIVPGAVGGAVGVFAETTVQLGVVGKPVRTVLP